jgi:signal peptidase II
MRFLGLSALVALLLDQASKYGVIYGLNTVSGVEYPVLRPVLVFSYGRNYGINFGLFGDAVPPWVLIALAAAICVGVLYWVIRIPQPRIAMISAGCVIGGALGNVIDRIIFGYVLDFLNMSCCGIRNPFVFNVADIFIFIGAIGLIFWAKDGRAEKKGT